MKKRSFLLLLLFLIFFIILSKYSTPVRTFFLTLVNPIKTAYINVITLSKNYFQQEELIQKLQKENQKLREENTIQAHFLTQLAQVYKVLPSLEKKPYKNIYLVNTISYIKLNKLNEVLLTKPKNLKLEENHLYGLIQEDVVGGVALYKNDRLYGYLLSNPKCTFSVKIGQDAIPGLAQGDGNDGIIIKYIPRWSQVHIGDKVTTSGLDNIFFPNIPVGRITDVTTLDRYKQAKVKVYANLLEPNLFFLISDATPYITTNYIPNSAFPGKVYPFIPLRPKEETPAEATQTPAEAITPTPLKEQDYLQLYNIFWQKNLFDNNLTIETEQ